MRFAQNFVWDFGGGALFWRLLARAPCTSQTLRRDDASATTDAVKVDPKRAQRGYLRSTAIKLSLQAALTRRLPPTIEAAKYAPQDIAILRQRRALRLNWFKRTPITPSNSP